MIKLAQKEIEQFDFISKKTNENTFLGDDLANLLMVSPGP